MQNRKAAPVTHVTRSQFAESFFHLSGAPFSLDDYAFMRPIYDMNPNRVITLKTSRQVSKSTTLAGIILANSCLLPRDPTLPGNYPGGFRSLYVSPSVDQTQVFSYDRISPLIEESPFIKKHYYNRALRNNVFNKTLVNRANVYLRYAALSPDRLRGMSVDAILWDESQDLLLDVMEIVRQSMFTSKYKWEWIVGTPKRRQGTLAKYWKSSTQNEWAVKCQHCNQHNILGERNIGKKGLVCAFCDKLLDPRIGEWVCCNPDARNMANINEGFRISQLQFANAPWLDWSQDILHKYEHEGRASFYNEVLGLEYDDGVATLSEPEIMACGKDYVNGEWWGPKRPTFMGIDWGPANSTQSYTVVTIMSINEHKIPIVLFMKRFEGADADFSKLHDEIPKLCHKWGVKLIGADRGMGEASNAELRRRMGHEKVYEFQHSGTMKQPEPKWEKKSQSFTTNRNKEMGEFFTMIKQKRIVLPKYESFEHPHGLDMLSTTVDYDEKHGKMTYVNEDPDDTIHSIIFGIMAAKIAGAYESTYIY